VRRLDFGPGKMRPVRQVLDRRFASSPDEAVVWLRDAYSAHYFDSWGEWIDLSCDPKSRSLVLVQVLLVELDLMKDTDIFSKLGRGKMKSAVEENGSHYLDQTFQKIKAGLN